MKEYEVVIIMHKLNRKVRPGREIYLLTNNTPLGCEIVSLRQASFIAVPVGGRILSLCAILN